VKRGVEKGLGHSVGHAQGSGECCIEAPLQGDQRRCRKGQSVCDGIQHSHTIGEDDAQGEDVGWAVSKNGAMDAFQPGGCLVEGCSGGFTLKEGDAHKGEPLGLKGEVTLH
jgi:hypothetical protein